MKLFSLYIKKAIIWLNKAMEIKRNVKVAIKIIYQTTNSCSICSELTFLKILSNNKVFT